MLESLDFHYDDISSVDMGVMNVSMDSGLFDEIFLASRTINTFKVKGNDKSYLQDIERENISLPLTFFLPDNYTEDNIRAIKRWLNQEYYKPFYFDLFPHKIFYVMYQGDINIMHNGAGQGFINLELISNSPYSYSPVYSTTVSFNDSTNGTDYVFKNDGDLALFPEMWIKIYGDSRVQVNNLSNGIVFEFNDLALNETIYIDNAKEDILTDLDLTYRYDNFNDGWLQIDYGVNNLKVYGQCEITFRYRYTFLV